MTCFLIFRSFNCICIYLRCIYLNLTFQVDCVIAAVRLFDCFKEQRQFIVFL